MNLLEVSFLTVISGLLLVGCEKVSEAPSVEAERKEPDPERLLAERACSSCHAFVEPDRLPKRAWEEILPIMGYFLGHAEEGYIMGDEKVPEVRERLKHSFIFAQKGSIASEEWTSIQRYFEANAPDELERPDQTVSTALRQFSFEPNPWKGPSLGVTFLRHEGGMFKVGSITVDRSQLLEITNQGDVIRSHEAQSPVVDVIPVVNAAQGVSMDMVLQMGPLKNIDDPAGQVATRTDQMRTAFGPLQRPVDFVMHDFDKDGGNDIMVAEFGKYLGGISIYHQKETLTRHDVFSQPGATRFELRDVNQDGLMDFYCLVSQWDESIYLFINKGGLSFESKRLLQLPPYSGLAHFELVDFDGDGDDDIICSSGDSGDYTPFYKPFHGVRIFENEGDHRFAERWFFSQQGAYGTVSHDFDGDGDIDFGSIGHLASWFDEEEKGFVYFENVSSSDQPWSFKAHALAGVPDNCWILIDSADVDEDGDMDIILGANTTFLTPEIATRSLQAWAKEGGVISVLRNNLK